MAFVLEIETSFTQKYIRNYITSIARRYNINADIKQEESKIVCAFASEHEKLQECLEAIAQELPASLFLKSSKSYKTQEEPDALAELENEYPLSLGLCPSCQKEMFDVSSKRYYYPFSSCSCCGGNHSFVTAYPYKRQNSSFKFLTPCSRCQEEQKSVGFKEKHEINSCHDCGVPVRLVSKQSERYANDAGSFRTMFEVAAKAINDNKKLIVKTTFGYRVFYKAEKLNNSSILLMINASKITDHLSLITEEYHALLSIERPILNVTVKNENLKKLLGANTSYVKYPDEGFTILLSSELQKLGVDYIAYEECDENYDADMIMDYDLEVRPQSDMRVFLNKDDLFIAEGERVSFPSHRFEEKSLVSVANDYVGLPENRKMLFDSMENFDSISVNKAHVLEGVEDSFHKNEKIFLEDEAAFISVIAEHNAFSKRAVCAYFDEEPSFLYYDGKSVLRIVPPKKFDGSKIIEDIKNLRDGSDRLIINLEKNVPEIYTKLLELQEKKSVKLFEAVAILLGLEDESMRGVTKEAMKFVGKGGIQIDTHVTDNRFDHAAFLASIISYQLAGVSTSILSYSIFESFGDYFNEILQELKSKTKATEIVLCGTHFSNQSLFSRMQRNLKMTPPLMNKCYPIGKENAVVGGVFL
jgi:hydrogenase maturation factor HypF (carbamoyltransferase family)